MVQALVVWDDDYEAPGQPGFVLRDKLTGELSPVPYPPGDRVDLPPFPSVPGGWSFTIPAEDARHSTYRFTLSSSPPPAPSGPSVPGAGYARGGYYPGPG
jgi:hypothetical protein